MFAVEKKRMFDNDGYVLGIGNICIKDFEVAMLDVFNKYVEMGYETDDIQACLETIASEIIF